MDHGALCVAPFLPFGDLRDQEGFVLDPAVQALAAEHAYLDLDLVQPAGVARRLVELEPL